MSAKKEGDQLLRRVNPFGLRLLPELKRRLEEAAAARTPPRSLNSEIVARIEESFLREEHQARIAVELAKDRIEPEEFEQLKTAGMVGRSEVLRVIRERHAVAMVEALNELIELGLVVSSGDNRAPGVPPAKPPRRRRSSKP